jgi:hypothetical protein
MPDSSRLAHTLSVAECIAPMWLPAIRQIQQVAEVYMHTVSESAAPGPFSCPHSPFPLGLLGCCLANRQGTTMGSSEAIL